MPTPSQQREYYARLSELFGSEWADRNWPHFARMLNNPSMGSRAVEEFISSAQEQKDTLGVNQLPAGDFQPYQAGTAAQAAQRRLQGQPAETAPLAIGSTLASTGLRNDPQQAHPIEERLAELQNLPGGAEAVSNLDDYFQLAGKGGYSDEELRGLNAMIDQAMQQQSALQDPAQYQASQELKRRFDPNYASEFQTPVEYQRPRSYGMVEGRDLSEIYDAAHRARVGQPSSMHTDTGIGDLQAMQGLERRQLEQQLADPNLDESQRAGIQQQLDAMYWPEMMLKGMNVIGPGSLAEMPLGLDTSDRSMAGVPAQMQVGAGKGIIRGIADPRRWLWGAAAGEAAEAATRGAGGGQTFNTTDVHHGEGAGFWSRNPGSFSGFNRGGFYGAPSEEQARQRAYDYISALEMQQGEPLDATTRSTIVQDYLAEADQLAADDLQYQQNFGQQRAQDARFEQAINTVPQAFLTEEGARQQAGLTQARPQQPSAFRRGFDRLRQSRPGQAIASSRAAQSLPGRAATLGAKGLGRGVSRGWERFGPLGLATGAYSALDVGRQASDMAASATGGPSLGTDLVGAGATGLTFAGTEAALPQMTAGMYQVGRGLGADRLIPGAAKDAFRGASNAFNQGVAQGGKGFGSRLGAMGKNLKTLAPRAMNAARAFVNPAARPMVSQLPQAGAQAGRAAAQAGSRLGQIGQGLRTAAQGFAANPMTAGAGQMGGRMAQLGMGARNLMSGGILGSMAIDAGINAGDAYGMVFGDPRARGMVRGTNQAMAGQAANRGAVGDVLAAPNVVSQARTMMGASQDIGEAQQGAAQTRLQGANTTQQNVMQQDYLQRAQQAGMDPGVAQEYLRAQQAGLSPEDFDLYTSGEDMQQARQLYETTQREHGRRAATSGFGYDDRQALANYMAGRPNEEAGGGRPGWQYAIPGVGAYDVGQGMIAGSGMSWGDILNPFYEPEDRAAYGIQSEEGGNIFERVSEDPRAAQSLDRLYTALNKGDISEQEAASMLGHNVDPTTVRQELNEAASAHGRKQMEEAQSDAARASKSWYDPTKYWDYWTDWD